jgi:N-acetylglutamate synthase-like GNAT family acetyltransferase
MNTKITIRAYSKTDKPCVLELLKLNTPQYFSEEEEQDFVFFLENEIEQYYIFKQDQLIIGCGGINFEEEHKIGKISWDLFHPKYQGKGFGSLLLKYRIEKLKSNRIVETILVRTSQLVYKFYEKQGFELLEVKEDFWAKGFDMYLMKYKNLNKSKEEYSKP